MAPNDETLFDKVVNLSKRRGFVFQSADIYGGFRSTYDYGPIGVLLLRNVKEQWWRTMVQLRHHCSLTLRSSSCLLYTSPSPRDGLLSRMPSSA